MNARQTATNPIDPSKGFPQPTVHTRGDPERSPGEPGEFPLSSRHDEWARAFDDEQTALKVALGSLVLDIQHVGSTAVAGVPAKPILDILAGVSCYEEAEATITARHALGYAYRGEHGVPRRRCFVKGHPRTHHLHMVEIDGPD